MLLIILIFFLIALTKADVATDLKYIKVCNETSPISLETMNKVLIYKKLEGKNSSNFKCFLHCLFAKYHWMDEEGGFLVHEIKKMLDEVQLEISSLEFILFKCTAITSVDKCERAFLFTQCFWKKVVRVEQNRRESEDNLFYKVEDKK